MRVALHEQLLLNCLRQDSEYSHGLLGQTLLDKCILLSPGSQSVEFVSFAAGQKLVDLLNQNGELRNKLNHTLRDDSYTKVHALCCSLLYRVCNVVSDLGQRHLLLSDFLRNQADVRLGLQCALQSYVRSASSHNLYKMPVLLSGVCVTLDVTDDLAVGLGSSIETEGALDILILQVAVDGLRAADNLYAGVVCCKVLSQNCCIGIGIVAADDNNCGYAMLLANLGNDSELLLSLQLGTAGTDDIESAGISVCVNELIVELYIIIVDQSAGAALETVQYVLLVGSLQCVVETADNVVSARSLSAGKDNAYYLLLGSRSVLALLEGDFLLTVGVREQRFDLVLIRYALCSFAFFYANICDAVSEHARKLRSVLISGFL